jgi:hypothetical protein
VADDTNVPYRGQNLLIYSVAVAGLPHRWLAGLPVRFQKETAKMSFAAKAFSFF